jgi:hypothetical protein
VGQRRSLAEGMPNRLTSLWHINFDLDRSQGVMTEMAKRRKPGFETYWLCDESFFDLITQPRARRPIP